MRLKKVLMSVLLPFSLIALTACGQGNDESPSKESSNTEMNSETMEENNSESHGEMNHSSSGEVPEDLNSTKNPTYEVGSKAKITTDHMLGMEGAEATVSGAYTTTVYTISYTPTTGGERVEDHKWVIHEEIKNAGDEPLEPGAEVTINASHMKGMDGATAKIDSAQETTVYMVDYVPTTGGKKVTNHKWVTEGELAPIQ
ncbi:YdhK family protein [Virgibacillus halodenitrificans]|uniref:YdhK family protein n=1 Tax=Virgibacillus halodenitrificans TaxID=1482 RepID=UPI000311DAC2|nr:YdhK family protein [Virgibacillus halodenitrificans]